GEILTELSWPRVPDLQALHKSPDGSVLGDPAVGIVFDTGARPEHRVRPGLMPADRKPLMEEVAERLAGYLCLRPSLNRAEAKSPRRPRVVAAAGRSVEQQDELEGILRVATDGNLTIDAFYQTTETLHALRDELSSLIGIAP